MNARIALMLLALALAACDDRQVEVEVPPVEPEAEVPASPIGLPPLGETMVAPAQVPEVPPAPGAPAVEPEDKVVLAPDTTPKKSPVAKPAALAEVETAQPPLDLSLPEQWGEQLAMGQSSTPLQLLPPLFERQVPPAPVQFGGRLIAGEFDDDITGAEIMIEFRR
ncbi:hypothetical protein [Stutzerimonas tarimensis]|uniref:Translation initiation factor 2 n=1 Tax=Stutzerimonas tarimensis TaxID=1507735 RepID=A0ABV7T8X5_9GAMM